MSALPNVLIVMARCSLSSQGFGIRFEEKSRGQWVADWAFPINETSARKEGYDRAEIVGSFGFDIAYPGCPHCRASSIFRCACGGAACWDGERRVVQCPWCGGSGELRGQIESIGAGEDR